MHPAAVPADDWRVFEGYPVLVGPSWGWTATVGAHALRVIYSGVFDEFPGASLTLGTWGAAAVPDGRLDSRFKQVGAEHRTRQLPSYYLRNNVYVSTSGVMSHAALLGAIHAVGVDRVLFAIDYPFESSADGPPRLLGVRAAVPSPCRSVCGQGSRTPCAVVAAQLASSLSASSEGEPGSAV